MATSFPKILNSELFKFIVGEAVDGSATEFSVHKDAIAQLSQPLLSITNSGPESKIGEIIWKNVGKETFERFAQYAYTGDYSIPATINRSSIQPPNGNGIHQELINGYESLHVTENGAQIPSLTRIASKSTNGIRGRVDSLGSDEVSPTDVNNGPTLEKFDDGGTILNYPVLSVKKNKKKKAAKATLKAEKEAPPDAPTEPQVDEILKPEQPEIRPGDTVIGSESTPNVNGAKSEVPQILTEDFQALSYPLLASRDTYEGTCEPSVDFEKDHSYSNVLLSHAALYALGDAQTIHALKALALYKLHKTLCTFELDSENIGDITDLARYAYSSEESVAEEENGALRGLVCQYMAIHAKELSADANFMNLLVGGGQIVKDFVKLQLQRVN